MDWHPARAVYLVHALFSSGREDVTDRAQIEWDTIAILREALFGAHL